MDAEIRSVLEEAAVTIMLHAEPLEQETQAQGDLQERRMERERQELVVVDGRIQSVMTAIEDGLYTPALKTRMQQLKIGRPSCVPACRLPAPTNVRF